MPIIQFWPAKFKIASRHLAAPNGGYARGLLTATRLHPAIG
jgi:hypothetical protein